MMMVWRPNFPNGGLLQQGLMGASLVLRELARSRWVYGHWDWWTARIKLIPLKFNRRKLQGLTLILNLDLAQTIGAMDSMPGVPLWNLIQGGASSAVFKVFLLLDLLQLIDKLHLILEVVSLEAGDCLWWCFGRTLQAFQYFLSAFSQLKSLDQGNDT